jgi:2-amino-4-hydroxy-6-hydroxymethyldihydropteridine diphosphokinase
LRSSAEPAYLGLGSNIGDRQANLRTAVALLRDEDGVEVVACSSVYETEAMDGAAGQRDFLNAAVRVLTSLDPYGLLGACKAIERRLGREPAPERHAPREIDVDVLLVGDRILAEPGLVVPHPAITTRRFVLAPLLEIDPGLELPGGPALADALSALGEGQRVERVGPLEAASKR